MGNKIKPWQNRKPKNRGQDDHRRKRVVPLRAGGDRRIVPLTVDDSRVIPMTAGDNFDLDEGPWES
jgi:hypothetical protein